jgi:hypothetical protein
MDNMPQKAKGDSSTHHFSGLGSKSRAWNHGRTSAAGDLSTVLTTLTVSSHGTLSEVCSLSDRPQIVLVPAALEDRPLSISWV